MIQDHGYYIYWDTILLPGEGTMVQGVIQESRAPDTRRSVFYDQISTVNGRVRWKYHVNSLHVSIATDLFQEY
jgi:hypothetical protein